jgi:hypothetical protein
MNIDYSAIDELFRLHDIDGLIASGAPDDEYEPEVEKIFARLETLPSDQATVPALVSIFEGVWTQMCGGNEKTIARRRPDFEDIAQKVMNYFG